MFILKLRNILFYQKWYWSLIPHIIFSDSDRAYFYVLHISLFYFFVYPFLFLHYTKTAMYAFIHDIYIYISECMGVCSGRMWFCVYTMYPLQPLFPVVVFSSIFFLTTPLMMHLFSIPRSMPVFILPNTSLLQSFLSYFSRSILYFSISWLFCYIHISTLLNLNTPVYLPVFFCSALCSYSNWTLVLYILRQNLCTNSCNDRKDICIWQTPASHTSSRHFPFSDAPSSLSVFISH